MLNDRIETLSKLGAALTKTEEYLSKLADSTPYSSFEHKYIWMNTFMSCWDFFSSSQGDNCYVECALVAFFVCTKCTSSSLVVADGKFLDVLKGKLVGV